MKKLASVVVSCALFAGSAGAVPLVWSSGDLGNNVITGAGDFTLNPTLFQPTGNPALLTVEYGLWNSPNVFVDVFLNGSLVGGFEANQGFIIPGPSFASFDVTGLLLDGNNTLFFTGNGSGLGDYVIGSAEIRYDGVPAPGAAALLALGGVVAGRRRR